MINLAVVNESSVLDAPTVKNYVAAQQIQIDRDFYPKYGIDAIISFYDTLAAVPATSWLIALLDNSDQAGALGYHETTNTGLPLAKIFAKTDQTYKLNWTITASHEVMETLADPEINLTVLEPPSGRTPPRLWAYEACDAVEADAMGYAVTAPNGISVMMSNFVLPSYFTLGSPGPWDFQKLLTGPFTIGKGGYESVMNLGGNLQWQQILGDNIPSRHASIKDSPRRLKRWSKIPGNVTTDDLYSGIDRGSIKEDRTPL